MKIAIIGTRGIPNNYGGFEQFAERVSLLLKNRGHELTVYNPHFHNYKFSNYEGVNIIKKFMPENILGGFSNFIYDSLCIKHSAKQNFDIVLLCGYPTAIFSFHKMQRSKNPTFVINVDGLEWSRSRWSVFTKYFIKWAEIKVATSSINLISDHNLISEYYKKTYNKKTQYIPYGADLMLNADENILKNYNLTKQQYFIAISRIEKDNNLQTIIDGFFLSGSDKKLVMVGNFNTKYGKKLKSNYSKNSNLIFLDSIYDINILNNLRYFSSIYFHGHSVGGTNPSLLEAMASKALIVAHNNIYNKSILELNALYFESSVDVKNIINSINETENFRTDLTTKNFEKIKNQFSWESVVNEYENLFVSILKNRKTIKKL
jgi:glycosyltransferase involved in cell wall biosynthesis